ncbi:nSTAND1 domain-containing NTPase [Streptomyces echinatus]|uniref:nSTAND1 domain-containing NTPase n=1 Tax=Streptomyces echinatus TaxID=67293 RepID=UPI003830B378
MATALTPPPPWTTGHHAEGRVQRRGSGDLVSVPGRARSALRPSADTFVIVDQFEEILTLCHDPSERNRFLDLLLTAHHPASRLGVLITVRADFHGPCAEHRRSADALRDTCPLVGPMHPAKLWAASAWRGTPVSPSRATTSSPPGRRAVGFPAATAEGAVPAQLPARTTSADPGMTPRRV